MTFESLRIDIRCLEVLQSKGISEPTPIQAKAIPIALEGRDLVAIAQTGTGKTLAFGLPTLTRLAGQPRGKTGMLVLAPTRELVQQVHDVIQPIAKALNLTIACVYGGVGMGPQEQALRRGASIVIACPGRLLDHIGRGNAKFDGLSVLVLDEADRMLDMGFLPDIRRIIGRLPKERQTMMFSATFPTEIARLASSMMHNPERVEASAVARPVEAVRQLVYAVEKHAKTELLKHVLNQEEVGTTLVFLRTKHATERLARVLSKAGFDAESIHGGQSQNQRTRAIEGFKSGKHRILVATDVAARGLDVKGISHVINFDIPATADDYVHRIGRTARAGAEGDAITFVTSEDTAILRSIERAIGVKIDRQNWGEAELIDEKPRSPLAPGGRSGGRRRQATTVARPW